MASVEEVNEQFNEVRVGEHSPVDTAAEQPTNEQIPGDSTSKPHSGIVSSKMVASTGDAGIPSMPAPVERMLQKQHIAKKRTTKPNQDSTTSYTTEGDSGPVSTNDYSTTSSDTYSTSASGWLLLDQDREHCLKCSIY